MNTLNLSAIIPAYCEAESLALLLPELAHTLAQWPGQHEIIVVNDGSPDDGATSRAFQAALAGLPEHLHARLIHLSRNFGKEAALSAGLAAAQGDAVVMLDADGQHPLALIDKMRDHILEGCDMAAAVQTKREQEPWWQRLGKRSYYHFMEESGQVHMMPNAGDFRMLNRKAVNALLALPERSRFMKGLYAWIGFKTVYLPFEATPRLAGTTKFDFIKLANLAISGILSFSVKPLRMISTLGLGVSLFSLVYGFYIVFDTLFLHKSLPGWPTLAAGMMLLSGVQLICLGVIGEYIGGIYVEVKRRPSYLVDSVETVHPN